LLLVYPLCLIKLESLRNNDSLPWILVLA
jgi:hypothetical protein